MTKKIPGRRDAVRHDDIAGEVPARLVVLDHDRKIADATPAGIRTDPCGIAAYLSEGEAGEDAA